MRRLLSILLVIFFGFGPLTATLHGGDDPGLPACCRRNGAHHCAMADEALARIAHESGAPAFSAPSHCPLYPHAPAVTVAPVHALAARVAAPAFPGVRPSIPTALHLNAAGSYAGTHSGRGPPAFLFA